MDTISPLFPNKSQYTLKEYYNIPIDYIIYTLNGNDSTYLHKVDSVLNWIYLNPKKKMDVSQHKVNWISYKERIQYSSNKTLETLSRVYLGDSCLNYQLRSSSVTQ